MKEITDVEGYNTLLGQIQVLVSRTHGMGNLILQQATETLTTRQQELEAMHPAARAAREADYTAHPEKCPPVATPQEGWNFYVYDSMNKISAKNGSKQGTGATAGTDTDTSAGTCATELQFIAPNMAALTATGNDYQLVNPTTGELMEWVCHGHPCLIYTSLPLEEGMLVRS